MPSTIKQRPDQRKLDPRVAAAAFETDLGYMAVAVDSRQVLAVTFGYPDADGALDGLSAGALSAVTAVVELPDWAQSLVTRLTAFAAGEAVEFADASVDHRHLTPFGRRVQRACRRIAYGKTVTYGELAEEVGAPRAARAVGSQMAGNRFPLIVPCHRVVAAGGGLGGYSAPQGLKMKERLLAMERSIPATTASE